MRKWLAVFIILSSLLIVLPAHAQGPARLSSLNLQILPEYDRPAVLVIMDMTLPSDTKLPASITLRVPAGADVNAVAESDSTGVLRDVQHAGTVAGEWNNITFTVDYLSFRVEYYYSFEKSGTSRHFVYDWAGDYAVDSFSIILQQPTGATGLATVPDLPTKNIGQDGFMYFRSDVQSLAAGQPYRLAVDYSKANDVLSNAGQTVQPAQPLDGNIPGRTTMTSGILPWLLAGIGGALIVAAVVVGLSLWRSGSRRPSGRRRRHSRPIEEPQSDVYCHECGKRAQPGDTFCRTCGARLQKE